MSNPKNKEVMQRLNEDAERVEKAIKDNPGMLWEDVLTESGVSPDGFTKVMCYLIEKKRIRCTYDAVGEEQIKHWFSTQGGEQ